MNIISSIYKETETVPGAQPIQRVLRIVRGTRAREKKRKGREVWKNSEHTTPSISKEMDAWWVFRNTSCFSKL